MAKETIRIADKPTLDKILEFLLGDEAGLAVLKSLLEESADKAESTTDDLKEVNRAIDTISGYLTNNTYGLNAIKTAISGRANESTSTSIKNLLENGTYGLNALKTAITGNLKAIKSVQSGLLETSTGTDPQVYDITISPVVMSKTFVIAQPAQFALQRGEIYRGSSNPYAIRLVNTTTIQIAAVASLTKLAWQVVEFY